MRTSEVAGITVPPSVAEAVCQRWPDRGRQWLDGVHDELDDVCSRLGATPTHVLEAKHGFLVSADSPSGRRVLRSSPDPNGATQAAVFTTLADAGLAPTLHAALPAAHGTWTVMDEVVPGTRLSTVELTDALMDSLATMLRSMDGRPVPVADMPTLGGWLRDRLNDDHLTDLPDGQQIAPAWERRDALATLDSLAATAPAGGLCHGDLNFGNVLLGSRGQLMVVDPRGVSGESGYDLAVVALWSALISPRSATVIATELAGKAGVDPARALAWLTVATAARVTRTRAAHPGGSQGQRTLDTP